MSVPDTTQEQAGVDAYTQWKANVSNERSSAYGGNLHDLARRIYIAMTNAAPQEISAEASRQADVESSKAKKPGAPASTPCRTGEAETPCEAAPNAIVTEVERIPAGWKLVPVEPTHEMIKAYKNAMRNHIAAAKAAGTTDRWKADARGFTIKEREKAFARWTAMLGAVSSIPSPQARMSAMDRVRADQAGEPISAEQAAAAIKQFVTEPANCRAAGPDVEAKCRQWCGMAYCASQPQGDR